MSIPYVVDGETDLDSTTINPWIDAMRGSADYPIALAGIEGALETYAPLRNMRAGIANVLDYGAVDDGTTDNRAAIQAAIDTGAGVIEFPPPASSYRVTSGSLVPLHNQTFRSSSLQYIHSYTDSGRRTAISAIGDFPLFAATGVNGVTVDGLLLTGSANTAHTSNRGFDLTSCSFWTIKNCGFNNFASSAVLWKSGVALKLYDCLTTNCVLNHSGHTDYIGVFDLGGTDPWVQNNEVNASCSAIGTGYIFGYAIRSANGFYAYNIAEFCEGGFVVTSDGGDEFQNVFVGNRADLNYGHGYVVDGGDNIFLGCKSFRNGQAATNTYDGFVVAGTRNTFMGCNVGQVSSDAGVKVMRYGFNDSSTVTDESSNVYLGNKISGNVGTAKYNVSDTENQVISFETRTANADTSGATLGQLETEVNEIKALLRTQGLMKA